MFDLLFKRVCVWFYYYLVSILFLKQWFQGLSGLSDASVNNQFLSSYSTNSLSYNNPKISSKV